MVKHDSDSSSSETDDQYSDDLRSSDTDDNRTSHDSIIKQLSDIKHALKIHHAKHGGSIKLGKAFHDVGHEVMSGLGLLSKLKRLGKIAKPVVKHLGHLALEKLKKTPAFHEGKIDPVAHIRNKYVQDGSDYYEKRAKETERSHKKTLAELDAEEEVGFGLVPKHRRQDTSDSPIRSLKFGEMEISSDHPLLNKLSTSDVEDFTKLFEMSKGKKKMDNKKYEALRKLIIKKLKDSVHIESIKKVDARFTRIVRGSDAAKEWAAKMKAARDSKRDSARDLKRK